MPMSEDEARDLNEKQRKVLNALRIGLQLIHPDEPNVMLKGYRKQIDAAVREQMGLVESLELKIHAILAGKE